MTAIKDQRQFAGHGMTTLRFVAIGLVLMSGCAGSQLDNRSPFVTVHELQRHVHFLASDSLGGRKAGERGNEIAAQYIANEFASYGLKPAGDNGSYLQHFPIVTGVSAGPNNSVNVSARAWTSSFVIDRDFRTLSISPDTTITAGLSFVGYGIESDSSRYNDYAGIDVKGKIVLALRFTPDFGSRDSKFDGWEYAYRKAYAAREHGAVGMILVTGPADEGPTPRLMPLQLERQQRSVGIPVVHLMTQHVDSILHRAGVSKDLRSIQQSIYDSKAPASFEIPGVTVQLQTQLITQSTQTANVLAFLEGSDAGLKNDVIVIGAHFDHLGLGGQGSGSLAPDTVAIHHGADDNASGTAGLLEAAQYFAAQTPRPKRGILFAGFTAEEMGLLGSAHYVSDPPMPLERTIAMINMDMIGRMRDSVLVVEGMGTSPIWDSITTTARRDLPLKITFKPDGFGPSDHASFYGKNIPVLFFFTNLHADYHRPSDTWEKINYAGEKTVVEYVTRIVGDVANRETPPAFTQVVASGPHGMGTGDRRGPRVSLGIVPDYADDGTGLKLSGTRPGSAAEKAGLKGGDVIIRFSGKDVKNIYDFMYALDEHKPGDEVEIIVKRDAGEVTLNATLEGRN
jgi:aminopeptidase YwaD